MGSKEAVFIFPHEAKALVEHLWL